MTYFLKARFSAPIRVCAWFGFSLLWFNASLAGVVAKPPPGTFEVLARLDPEGCRSPSSPLARGPDGNFYGAMEEGGSRQGGCLYRVTPKGKVTILHEFDASNPQEGSHPIGELRFSANGTLLGTTLLGGGPSNGGSLFRSTVDGEITYLKRFGMNPLGPKGPTGAPIRASDGRLYGSLAYDDRREPGGLVYSMNEDGSDWRVLHTFALRRTGDLAGPWGPLMQGADGALYGAVVFGPIVPDGGMAVDGAIFRLTLGGDYRVLHTMYVVGDGTNPQGSLVQTADGSIYGTNSLYGGDGNIDVRGTLFRLSTGKSKAGRAKFKVLFTGNEHGIGPRWLGAPLTLMPDGSLWSVSVTGGNFGYGTVYRFTTSGAMQVMHSFDRSNGAYPISRLTPTADGWLYGITSGAVVFRVKAM